MSTEVPKIDLATYVNKIKRELDAIRAEGRPKSLHAHPCAHCPTIRSPDDPESVGIRDLGTREEKLDSVFRCAWRREKACRGYADFIGVTEEDLDPDKEPPCLITDRQIRELRTALLAGPADDRQLSGLVACNDALGRSHRRSRARAHCAALVHGKEPTP